MSKLNILKSTLIGGASAIILASGASAKDFNIPSGDLGAALNAYTMQTGMALVVSGDAVKGVRTRGAKGDLSWEIALSRILANTGFKAQQDSGVIAIVRDLPDAPLTRLAQPAPERVAEAASASAGIESVVVTSSKIKGDIQTVPIAITALSQEQLTSRQIAGGPDLVKEVPNLTFSKTNFSGYNLEIRGIGTQAISVTTDPAVAVAFNDVPFIRNHFFEQEFYDVNQVEVLRGPQGTLYGRNATAGVVNVISAKPTDQFEAMTSADFGNYHNRRFEGMINVPIVDDRLDLRVAGEWTKRDGYSFNELTNSPIDGRDLWSGRVTLAWKPSGDLQAALIWEHFSENDDRLRSGKQLCKAAPAPGILDGISIPNTSGEFQTGTSAYLSQGCQATSLYSPDAFEIPSAFALPYYTALSVLGLANQYVNPYVGATQSRNLRTIESALNPVYKAKNDIVELNTDWNVTPALAVTFQTAFNHDFLWSTEDFNRFTSSPGLFLPNSGIQGEVDSNGVFCDPQLGCSDRLVAEDLSDEHAWQLSQEVRIASNFSGPLNFSFGGNYLHYETEENYYVFFNTLTAFVAEPVFTPDRPYPPPWVDGVSDNHQCLRYGLIYADPTKNAQALNCSYIDPNPIPSVNNQGHNYFLSKNPYLLNSYAGFGEVYYNVTSDLKLTGGLRWTDDKKHFIDIPSELLAPGYGYPSTGVIDQQWSELTGRGVANWTPKLDFTDQTLVYSSYAHGYKAGGANPPGAVLLEKLFSSTATVSDLNPIHPLTFKPEFIDAYELGTKNTLLDGALTFNGDVFYYNYKDYQISEIVDRTSINLNFNATVKGAELETAWEPAPGLKFSFAGGYEDATLNKGDQAVDLMDRTAGNPEWVVVKPFITQASNCILPIYVVAAEATQQTGLEDYCVLAYTAHFDPFTGAAYIHSPNDPFFPAYLGFDPVSPNAKNTDNFTGIDAGPAPNNGAGFDKNLSGKELPNAPHFTTSLSADYTMPVSEDWAATLHSDFYWQSQSFARVFNDRPYDKIRGYSTTNLALILTSASGWQVMGYLKNVFNVTAITGDFLNSDDTGLTTNVFLTDPRLYGVRVTKNF